MWKILVALGCIFNIAAANTCFKKYHRDCKEAFDSGKTCSGVYTIKPDNLPPFQVYCDMESDGGGWVVFQRRMDGTEDFYRNWTDYVKGFGDLNGEFWLGLNKIHRLTQAINTTLRVDLADFEGETRYAKYTTFQILDSSRKYQLNIGDYSGDAGDSMTSSTHSINGMEFTTKDQDNDIHGTNCTVQYKGAWWYFNCHQANLNGLYLSGAHTTFADGVNWGEWKGYYYSLKISEMKLKHEPDNQCGIHGQANEIRYSTVICNALHYEQLTNSTSPPPLSTPKPTRLGDIKNVHRDSWIVAVIVTSGIIIIIIWVTLLVLVCFIIKKRYKRSEDVSQQDTFMMTTNDLYDNVDQ